MKEAEIKKTNKTFYANSHHLPAWTEFSSIWVALVKLLQHLLTLTVRERVTEGEVGGGSSHLRKPVSEREDELVVYDLESD